MANLLEQAKSPDIHREGPEHTAWKTKVQAMLAASLGPNSPVTHDFEEVRYSIGIWTGAPGEDARDRRIFSEAVDRAAAILEAGVFQLEAMIDDVEPGPPQAVSLDGPLFVVHGHDETKREQVVRLLERTTGRDVTVLHEQPNSGATILEKFERHAQSASFAVILLTGDDEGRARGSPSELLPRGRQNVILEMGFYWGCLGRTRLAMLVDEDVERPSDLDGLVYIPLDAGGAWKLKLVNELAAAGIAVDRARIPG